MPKCVKCGKNLGFIGKKFHAYPGGKEGSLELSREKVYCGNCYPEPKDKNPDDAARVIILMQQKKYDEALECLESIFDENSSADWYSKGNILMNLEKLREALRCYDKALFLDTHYIKAWYRKGWCLLWMERYDDAKKCFVNIVNLEKGELKDYLKISRLSPTKLEFEAKSWAPAAMLGTAIALTKLGDKGAAAFFMLVKAFMSPAFDNMGLEDFTKYCVQNLNQVSDLLEPRVILGVLGFGEKH